MLRYMYIEIALKIILINKVLAAIFSLNSQLQPNVEEQRQNWPGPNKRQKQKIIIIKSTISHSN